MLPSAHFFFGYLDMKLLSPIIKAACVIALFCAGFFFSDITAFMKSYTTPPIPLEDTCHLSKVPCIKNNTTITLEHETLTPLQPSLIVVDWANPKAQHLIISLRGHEMEMGNPVYQLTLNEKNQFTGDILLPVCTQNSMTWIGTITDGDTSVPISFKAIQ